MKLTDALYRGITGRAPSTEGRSIPSMVTELRAAFGVKPPEGLSDRTWRRLRADPGGKYAPKTRDALQAAQRRLRLPADREKMLRGGPIIGLHAEVEVSQDIRERKILLNRWTSPGAALAQGDTSGLMDRVLNRWLAGDDAGAAEQFRRAAEDGLTGDAGGGRRLEIVNTHNIKFWTPSGDNARRAQMWQRT